MAPDLQKFRNQSAEQIVKTLLKQNYSEVSVPQSTSRFFRDSTASHLVRLSPTPRLTAAFCAASQGLNNPFLPKIFSHATLASDLHISVSENLQRLDEISNEPSVTLFGHARAVSSFFAGDDMHKDVHRCMIYEPAILEAAQTIIAVAVKEGRDDPKPATPHSINPCGDSIWFRNTKASCQTVYADPFMESQKTPAETRHDLQWMERRFTQQERDANSSQYWRDRQP